MSKPITPPSCPAKPTTPRELLSRAYPQLGTTLFMGTQIAPIRMTRHDLVVLLSMHPGQAFGIEAAGFSADVQAAVVAPNAPHTIHAKGCEIVHLAIQLFHPRFGALRSLLSQAVTPLAREKFAPLDSQLLDASDGRLDADEATQLVKDIGTVLLQAGTPSSRALDPRVVYALRKLAADIDYPFAKLAAELHVSRSRLSHLFAEQLGVSMRGCQAWLRLGMAWELVVWERELSLTAIAHLMKFSDSSHLARAFKYGYGMSPTQFRNHKLVEIIGTRRPG